ncbi:hypothetical protein QQF64_011317 [Cirrhinus molitorella]|uniref:Ig-like domain-containing protein n=1 Tax=Cirrhinus molitorella TaxID=172907 RepID=A0ABR3LYX0_9TELE
MTRGIIALILFLHWSQGTVVQKPEILREPKSSSASLNCTHNKGISYYQMYWYRQRPGETMRLIVFTVASSKPDFGDVDEKKFDAQKSDAKSGSLTVKDLEPEDSAIYFCAVRTALGDDVLQKPVILYELKGKSAQINCMHNKGSDYRLMYWYQQRQGQTMRLIAFITSYSDPEYADSEQNKFVANKTVPESGSLTVKNLEPNDSAMYFCSVTVMFSAIQTVPERGSLTVKNVQLDDSVIYFCSVSQHTV